MWQSLPQPCGVFARVTQHCTSFWNHICRDPQRQSLVKQSLATEVALCLRCPEWMAVPPGLPPQALLEWIPAQTLHSTSNTEALATLGGSPRPASCVENCSSHQITGLCISLNISEAAPSVFMTRAKTSTTTGIRLKVSLVATPSLANDHRVSQTDPQHGCCSCTEEAIIPRRETAHWMPSKVACHAQLFVSTSVLTSCKPAWIPCSRLYSTATKICFVHTLEAGGPLACALHKLDWPFTDACFNDPAAGSPTTTLLRLLLPLRAGHCPISIASPRRAVS